MGSVFSQGASTVRGLWQAARRQPWLLFGIPLVTAMLAVAAVLLAERRYRSDVSFIYESSNSMELPSAVMGIVSQLNLSRLTPSESPQFYAALLESRPVLNGLLTMRPRNTCDSPAGSTLLDMYQVSGKNREDSLTKGRQRLAKMITPRIDLRTTIVTASVEAGCPLLAAELADSLIATLNNFNIQTRQSTAKTRRVFVEARVAEADSSLRDAENTLEGFLRRNRAFDQSPDLTFQYTRLQRRVTHWQEISTGLRRQYESARIEEVNSTPVVTIIEPPAVPIRASWPRRRVVVILSTFLATIVGLAFAVGRTLSTPLPAGASPELRSLHTWAGLSTNGLDPAARESHPISHSGRMA
jgi:uncharacterized protein involved in exopolysaccharide biosynthesis